MPSVDPRRVVDGSVWAKATAVSNDSRRIYGVEVDKLWIHGTVLEVLVSRPDGARRATTLIKAKYMIGTSEKVKVLGLGQLKKENPQGQVAPPIVPATGDASSQENLEQSSSDNGTPPVATAPNDAGIPGSTETGTSDRSNNTTSSRGVPVATCHGVEWFADPNTEFPVNGTFVLKEDLEDDGSVQRSRVHSWLRSKEGNQTNRLLYGRVSKEAACSHGGRNFKTSYSCWKAKVDQR